MFDKKGIIYALAVTESVVWGFSFLGTKAALENLLPIEVLATRWTIGAIIMVIFAMLGIIKVNFKGKDLKPLMLVAFAQPCVYSICEVWGINLSTTSESAIIIALVPIFVLAFSTIIFRTRIGKVSVFAIILAFVGVICTTVFSPEFTVGGKILGYACLFGAVVAGAIFIIGSNKISNRFTSMEITVCMAVQGSIFFNLISLLQGNGVRAYILTFTNIDVFLSVMFLALGSTVLCYMIFNFVTGKLPAHQASTLQINLITLVGVISGITIQNDPFGWYTFVGMALMLAGIIITNMQAKE